MKRFWLACLSIVVAAPVAFAQEATESSEPVMMAGVSGAIWLPTGDADDFSDTSIGIRPYFGYAVRPFLSIVAAVDYIFVNEKDGVGDITYYSVSAGARLTTSQPRQLRPYGELLLGYHKLSADGSGVDDSGIGFRLGGGATYALGGNLVGSAGLSYSAVSIDVGLGNVDVDALVVDIGAALRF